MTSSLDFRKKILTIKEKECLNFREVATRFHIGVASIVRWSKNLKPLIKRNKPPIKIDIEVLKNDIKTNPDAYLI